MPTFIHGKDSGFLLDDTGGTLRSLTTVLTSVGFSKDLDTAETFTLGNDDKTYLKGMRGLQISLEGLYTSTADAILDGAFTSTAAGTFNWGPASTSTGASNPKYSGEVLCTAYELSSDPGSAVTFSATLLATGAITKGTF